MEPWRGNCWYRIVQFSPWLCGRSHLWFSKSRYWNFWPKLAPQWLTRLTEKLRPKCEFFVLKCSDTEFNKKYWFHGSSRAFPCSNIFIDECFVVLNSLPSVILFVLSKRWNWETEIFSDQPPRCRDLTFKIIFHHMNFAEILELVVC